MLYNIEYVYGKDKDDNKILVGAKVSGFDGKKYYKKEIYVGLEFALEDILESDYNAHALGIRNLDIFKAKYETLRASGIIYFPELDSYEFLEQNDVVIHWTRSEEVKTQLEEALQPYKNIATDKVVKQRVQEFVESLDPADPMIELNGLSLQRQSSNR